ncbi:hypothetical protein [Bradyrhizobium genosp. P]|uniref:hypothetical protein n=1 Tax=Bradyrhizobium genosp. P TaxID=83641 RepID=UPI003CEEC309
MVAIEAAGQPVWGQTPGCLRFQLIELGLLISNRNYAALLQASIAFVTGAGPAPKQLRSEQAD